MTVFKGNLVKSENRLSTKLFCKPTDTMELLHKNSHHPKHTFKGIIKSQVLRFHHLCTEKEDFETACKQLFTALKPRGYTFTFLWKIKKETLKELTEPTKGKPSPFHVYTKPPQRNHKVTKCGSKGCRTCPHVVESSEFKSTATNKIYLIHHNMDCKTKEIIYLVTCARCGIQYVGETGGCLQQRLWHYHQRIDGTKYPSNPTLIQEHFRPENDHNGLADFLVKPIAIRTNITRAKNFGAALRQELELFWINELRTKEPDGLNIKVPGENQVLPIIIRYMPQNQTWAKGIISKWEFDIKPVQKPYLPNRVLCALHKDPNLREHLSRAKLSNPCWHPARKENIQNIQEETLEQDNPLETLAFLADINVLQENGQINQSTVNFIQDLNFTDASKGKKVK